MKPCGVERDTRALEADVADVRRAADGPEHRVEAAEPAAVGGFERQCAASRAIERPRVHRRDDLDAARAHRRHELLAEQRVEVPQHRVVPDKHRHLAAECPQHPGQLDGDVAAADDRHAPRQLLELEEAVRRQPELPRPGTGGYFGWPPVAITMCFAP